MATKVPKKPKAIKSPKNLLCPEKKQQLINEYMNGKISQRDLAKKYDTSKTEVQRVTAGAKKDNQFKENNQISSQKEEPVNYQNNDVHLVNEISNTDSKSVESLQNFLTLDEIAQATGSDHKDIDEKIDSKRKSK